MGPHPAEAGQAQQTLCAVIRPVSLAEGQEARETMSGLQGENSPNQLQRGEADEDKEAANGDTNPAAIDIDEVEDSSTPQAAAVAGAEEPPMKDTMAKHVVAHRNDNMQLCNCLLQIHTVHAGKTLRMVVDTGSTLNLLLSRHADTPSSALQWHQSPS